MFFGGTEDVTGSNYLIEIDGNSSVKGPPSRLIGRGRGWQNQNFGGLRLVSRLQGGGKKNSEPFPYKPSSIDALLVTHAHLDHVGRIPKLVKDGFKGKIYSTYPTKISPNLC